MIIELSKRYHIYRNVTYYSEMFKLILLYFVTLEAIFTL